MPLRTNTRLIPGISRIRRSSSVYSEWSASRFGHGSGARQLRFLHIPHRFCFWQLVWRKLALGPPTSWMYPLNPGSWVSSSASSSTDSMDRLVTIRPWWKASAQKLHPPKHPRLWVMENCTSSMAGMPFLYMGCTCRV